MARTRPLPRSSTSVPALPMHTVATVAEICQVSERTVRRWIDAKLLKAHRLSRAVRISEADLQSFLDRSR